MLESMPLNSEIRCEFSSNNFLRLNDYGRVENDLRLNDYGRLENNTPFNSYSEYGSLQKVSNPRGEWVNGLYTNGFKTGTDINLLQDKVRLQEIGNNYCKNDYDDFFQQPSSLDLTIIKEKPTYGGYYFKEDKFSELNKSILKETPSLLPDYLLNKYSYDSSCPICGKIIGHASWCSKSSLY